MLNFEPLNMTIDELHTALDVTWSNTQFYGAHFASAIHVVLEPGDATRYELWLIPRIRGGVERTLLVVPLNSRLHAHELSAASVYSYAEEKMLPQGGRTYPDWTLSIVLAFVYRIFGVGPEMYVGLPEEMHPEATHA